MRCERFFSIGGRIELEQHFTVLRERVNAAATEKSRLRESLLQMAIEDVLEGKGDCRYVPLRILEALHLESKWDLGSDHPALRIENGQVPEIG